MTRRSRSSPDAELNRAEIEALAGLERAVARLRDVAKAILDDEIGVDTTHEAARSFFEACESALVAPDGETISLGNLLKAGDLPATVLSAYFSECALLGRPVMLPAVDTGELVPFVPGNIDEMGFILDRLDRLEPHERAERYVRDSRSVALAVGIQIARDGENEIFPVLPWSAVLFNRCLAAAAIVAATRAAAVLNKEEDDGGVATAEDPDEHMRHHDDVDGLVRAAAAAVDVLDDDERADLAGTGFGAISHLVEDLLAASEPKLPRPVVRNLSATLVASFLRGFDDALPLKEIVNSPDQDIVRLLGAADVAGRMAAARLEEGHGADDDDGPTLQYPVVRSGIIH